MIILTWTLIETGLTKWAKIMAPTNPKFEVIPAIVGTVAWFLLMILRYIFRRYA